MKKMKNDQPLSGAPEGSPLGRVLNVPTHDQTGYSRFTTPTDSGVRAILFDCDGVLCPPMKFADVLESQHRITREMTAEFFKGAFLPALRGTVDVLTLLPPYLREWGWQGSPESFMDVWLSSEREVRAGLVEMISELRHIGYLVGAATNQESRRARYLREAMGFEKIFDRCFISSELGHMKPQPEYFHTVTQQLGVAPREIIFLDDQQPYLEAAQGYGWRTILFTDEGEARVTLQEALEAAAQEGGQGR